MIFSAVRRRLQRRIPAIVRYLRIGMRYAPPRLVFFCIVLAMKAGLPGSRLLPRAFAALVLLRLSEDPKYRFARSSSHALAATTIEVLYRSGAYEEAVEYVDRDLALSMRPRKFLRSLLDMGEGAGDYGDGNSFFLARSRKLIFKAGSLFELGRFAEALEATRSAVQLLSSRNEPNWLRLRGHLELLCGDETVGGEFYRPRRFEARRFYARTKISRHTPRRNTFRQSSTKTRASPAACSMRITMSVSASRMSARGSSAQRCMQKRYVLNASWTGRISSSRRNASRC